MKPTTASAVAALALLSSVTPALASPKVLQMDMKRNQRRAVSGPRLGRRASKTVGADLGNLEALGLYALNITVGTPPQPVTVQVDTGSSDLWVPVKNSKLCNDPNTLCQQLGSFDPNSSSTYMNVLGGAFDAGYGDGTEVVGDFGNDTVRFGGATIPGAIVSIAVDGKTTGPLSGIMGIGYPDGEAIVQESNSSSSEYPNIVQSLRDSGLINTMAYSVWLNDLNSADGSILFGGIDTDKFTPPLVTLPVQPDANGSFSQLSVVWTSMSFTGDGSTSQLQSKELPAVALLDSGTTFSALPDDLVNSINQGLGVFQSQVYGSLLPCGDSSDSSAMFTFGFGGAGGASINVSLSELLIPLTDDNNKPISFASGQPACIFTLQGGADEAGLVILGDAFMHAAYVVYDLENNNIGLAQTKFNVSSSNVVEISSGSALPSATTPSSSVTAPPITATGSGLIGPGGNSQATATATSLGSFSGSATFAHFTPTAATSSKSAAGSVSRNVPVEMAMVVSAAVGAAGFCGGLMMMLF